MTVSSEDFRISHNGGGTTGPFSFNFLAYELEHLEVVKLDLNGDEVSLEPGIDFTAEGLGEEEGGTIELSEVLAVGEKITITVNPPPTQELDLNDDDDFPAEAVERQLDLMVMMLRRDRTVLERALVLRTSDVDGAGAFNARGNRITNVGNALENTDVLTLGAISSYMEDIEDFVNDAEIAADDAEDALNSITTIQSAIELVSENIIYQGNVPIFPTVISAEAQVIPVQITAIRVSGYYSVGDGGDALWVSSPTEPSVTLGKFQDAGGRWWKLVHSDGWVHLLKLGLKGDGTDESAMFQDAVTTAQETGLYRLRADKRGIFKIKDIDLEHNLEIDLQGGTLLGVISGVPGSQGSSRMFTTDAADAVEFKLRNGTVDGGFTALGSSGYGDRTFFLSGGVVEFDEIVFKGTSNRQANVGSPIDIFSYSSYKAGEIVIYNANSVSINRCSFLGMSGEMLLVMSSDARTRLRLTDVIFDKNRLDNGGKASNSGLCVFNVHSSSWGQGLVFKNFVKSAANLMTNGFSLSNIEIDGVDDSTGLDCCESGQAAFTRFVFKDITARGVATQAVIRVAASHVIADNLEFIGCSSYGIQVFGSTTGPNWSTDGVAGAWFPAAGDRLLPNVSITNVLSKGVGTAKLIAPVKLQGASASNNIVAHVKGVLTHPNTSGRGTYAVDASHCDLTLEGGFTEGNTAVIRLASSGNLVAKGAVFDPSTTGHVFLLHDLADNSNVYLKDSRRYGNIGSGYDIGRSGTTSASLVRVSIDGAYSNRGDTGRFDTFDGLTYVEYNGWLVLSIADDDILDIYPRNRGGQFSVARGSMTTTPGPNVSSIVDYRATSSSPFCVEQIERSLLECGTGSLTAGTSDGTDGSLNISAQDGFLRFKNRMGATLTFLVKFL